MAPHSCRTAGAGEVGEAVVEEVGDDLPMGPSVQTHSRRRLRRPAMGVCGHTSLSLSSDSEESRLPPTRGDDTPAAAVDWWSEWSDGAGGGRTGEPDRNAGPVDGCGDEEEPAFGGETDASDETVEPDEQEAARSECARVYLVVLISSARGLRKLTRFVGGKIGRVVEKADILPVRAENVGNGPLERMERRLWLCR